MGSAERFARFHVFSQETKEAIRSQREDIVVIFRPSCSNSLCEDISLVPRVLFSGLGQVCN